MARNCGECLMNTVDVVELDPQGRCPKCGAAYGPDAPPAPVRKVQGRVKPITLDRVMRAVRRDDGTGFCIACGASQKFVEPDAERYPCNKCKQPKVFGAEQILLRVQA
jgi:Zn finger protein HypA/HybF involved in hydrogenase expression